MPAPVPGGILWWSPDPRGILDLNSFRASRSLRRSRRAFEVRVDTAFRAVMEACASETRPGGWINAAIIDAYVRLHELGWAHSIEVFDHHQRLVGGLYGVGIGGFFAGESMFHQVTDASKVALWATVEILSGSGAALFDVQWVTDHLASLGAADIPRPAYLVRLAEAVAMDVQPFSVDTHTR
jgi:leucyl/phenylalanyl-tRNA---protein transferase